MFLVDLPAYESEAEKKDTYQKIERKEDLQAYLKNLMAK